MKIFDFLNILMLLTIFTGVVTLVDALLRRKSKIPCKSKHYWIVEYSRSFFPVFLVVVGIRAFIFQPYRVPTGSLEPTVIPGDLIFVTQFNYGLKLPLWDNVLIPIGKPQRGDIALFRWPVNPKLTFVKRVIGLPGDHISYVGKVFTINGKKAPQKYLGKFREILANGKTRMVDRYSENLDGISHAILRDPKTSAVNFKELVVPQGYYFMVGDNRDDSDDSRSWGFVPRHGFIGRAQFVWFNVQFSPFKIRADRIGASLHGSSLEP